MLRKQVRGWRDGKILAAEDLNLECLCLHRKSGVVLCAWNPSTGKAETGGPHELNDWSSWMNLWVPGFWSDLVSKDLKKTLTINLWPSHMHNAHVCAHACIYRVWDHSDYVSNKFSMLAYLMERQFYWMLIFKKQDCRDGARSKHCSHTEPECGIPNTHVGQLTTACNSTLRESAGNCIHTCLKNRSKYEENKSKEENSKDGSEMRQSGVPGKSECRVVRTWPSQRTMT